MSIYDFSATLIDGEEIKLDRYKGKVMIVVNTASKCSYTPQFKDLENLYEKYNERGLEILAFPCNQFAEQDPSDNSEIQKFCQINFGVTFPLFEKIDVRGQKSHPLFKYLTEAAPFEGINQDDASGRMLQAFLNEKYQDYLLGDSIKWNFTKFLIDRNGNVVKRFESNFEPIDIENDIENLL